MRMHTDDIRIEKTGRIAAVILNRPASLNALDLSLGSDLSDALARCADDDGIRAVLITGTGGVFCAGGDIRSAQGYADVDEIADKTISACHAAILTIRRMPKPVIAAVNGITFAAGMSFAAACDIRMAAASAVFRQGYTSVGLTPDCGWTVFVPQLVGPGKASEMALLDPIITADQAREIGLVHSVVADNGLLTAARETAGRLACGPTAAFAAVKNEINSSVFVHLEEQLEIERMNFLQVLKSADAREGVAAFFEKRAPRFEGR